MASAGAKGDRNNSAPATESTVIVVKGDLGEVREVGDVVNAVVGTLFEVVTAHKMESAAHAYKRPAGFGATLGSGEVVILRK